MHIQVKITNLKLVSVHDNVHAAHLRQSKLLVIDARETDLLPGSGAVRLTGAVHSPLELLQVDQGDGEPGKVGHVVEEQLGRVVHLVLETALADLEDVGVVGAGDELFEVGQAPGLGVRVDQLGLDVGLAGLLARHLQVSGGETGALLKTSDNTMHE